MAKIINWLQFGPDLAQVGAVRIEWMIALCLHYYHH